MADPDTLKGELFELSQRWLRKLAERSQAIGDAAGLAFATPGDRAALEQLHFLVHRLGGSGTSFGFPEVSRSALLAEHTIKKLLASGAVLEPSSLVPLAEQIDALRAACAAAVSTLAEAPPSSGTPA